MIRSMGRLTWVFVGQLLWMLFDATGATAQLLQTVPRSPLETMAGSTERIPAGFYIMPWIAGGFVYDDNVFFQARNLKQDDVFMRVTPGLQGSYQSTPLSVIANYRFDAEDYSKHHNLSTLMQRQYATLDFRGRPANNWTLNNVFGFAQTRTPFELNTLTSVQSARIKTERYFVNPSTEYRPDSITRLQANLGVSKDIFGGGPEINTYIANLAAQRKVGAHDWLGPGYVGRHFTFSNLDTPVFGFLGGSSQPVTSHALLMTWAHEFTADTRLEVRAGPRMTNGDLDNRPEALVTLTRRIPTGELRLLYASVLTTVIGTAGSTRSDSIIAQAAYEPFRHVTFTLSPSAAWIKSGTFSATVYTAYVETAYQFNKYLTAKGSALFSYQEAEFASGSGGTTNFIVPRNVFWLRLEFTYPERWDY